MNAITCNPKISETFESVREFSFQEKQESVFEEIILDKFLDKILEFKNIVSKKTEKINSLVERIEKITWFNNLDHKSLFLINDLISAIRDLQLSLLRHYISFKFIRSKGIAKEEIKKFKTAIDDLKEIAGDLESVFFFLPNLPEFKETTKELSLI
ncbi:MAG: hypothetical protein EAZ15_08560 [Sphingobacteriales bacterium]|nr:MAG: hypothetical protein EAZ15_08560 [Sphingobacteriales bacterium]